MYIYHGKNDFHHSWTYEEDYYCCVMYMKWLQDNEYLTQRVEDFASLLHSTLIDISINSIKMKFQNIQYLINKHAPYLGRAVAPLDQYSMQNERAFFSALKRFPPKEPVY